MTAVFEQPDVRELLNKCRSLLALITRHSNAHTALRIQEQILQVMLVYCEFKEFLKNSGS